MEKHKESHRRILEQLNGRKISQANHTRTGGRKRKHKEYMEKSDEFISLLEQECERYVTWDKTMNYSANSS